MTDPAYVRPGDEQPATAAPQTSPEPYPTDEQASPTPAALPPQHRIERTRTGGLWVAVTSAVLVILLLLIFILQNGEQVEVSLFGAHPNLPLGVALLLAAVLGALIVTLLGAARVVQLRHVAKRHRLQDRTTQS